MECLVKILELKISDADRYYINKQILTNLLVYSLTASLLVLIYAPFMHISKQMKLLQSIRNIDTLL